MNHERITCDDVRVGDQVARARTHHFLTVEHIDELEKSRRLHVGKGPQHYGDNIRPRRSAQLWRLVGV
jgi:hypothetical protein